MIFSPRDYQGAIVRHIIENPRCALWAGMGTGKTASTLTALEYLDLIEVVYPALVIAPLRVAESVWPDEVGKWDHLKHLRVSPIVGSIKERIQALRHPAEIYTVNYETLPWLVEHLGEDWRFPTVVADESTKLKGFRLRQGTQRARALGSVAHAKVERFIELTGTPAPNGLTDLWGQAWYLDAGSRLGRTHSAFIDRWFRLKYDGYGLEPLPHAQGEIQARLADLCLTITAADYLDLPPLIENEIKVELSPAARRIYRAMEKAMFAQIDGHAIEAFNAAAKTNKCLQLANGAAYVDDAGSWREVHDAKLAALEDIVEEAAGAPVLVAYQFRSVSAPGRKRHPRADVNLV
ncbi:MAG TPA: SNF2-related protein [Accumulibacter sp.]|uniref:SNF2-related protein n=1 Tax=Accumulibacter sp. TaxID=2053492 RepID=UPI002B76DEFA|nr:SNF2-related protein [Accumulibacter sp.]HRF73853.1 SNF2-related protein [Accumulibacter sp.]